MLARFDFFNYGSIPGNDQTVFQLKKSIDLSSLAESKISETESDSSCTGHGYHVLNNDGDKVSFFVYKFCIFFLLPMLTGCPGPRNL